MKVFHLAAAMLLVLISTAGFSSLYGDTFYLADHVRVGREVRISELFLAPSSDNAGEQVLPIVTGDRFVFLSDTGLSRIAPGGLPGALIGSGVWLIPEDFNQVEEMNLLPLLRKIELLFTGLTDENGLGFSLAEADVALLASAQNFYKTRRGSVYVLETGKKDREPVPVSFLEFDESEPERVPAGTLITLFISRKGLIITAEGRTNRGASVGDRVPVTLTNTRRRFEALLTGSGEGEVRF